MPSKFQKVLLCPSSKFLLPVCHYRRHPLILTVCPPPHTDMWARSMSLSQLPSQRSHGGCRSPTRGPRCALTRPAELLAAAAPCAWPTELPWWRAELLPCAAAGGPPRAQPADLPARPAELAGLRQMELPLGAADLPEPSGAAASGGGGTKPARCGARQVELPRGAADLP